MHSDGNTAGEVMSESIFNQREMRRYNRGQAWLSLAILDFKSARRFLKRNKDICAAEREYERIDGVS